MYSQNENFFSLEMDIHLIRLCVEHNPYQLGKTQWDFILNAMKETFSANFLLRTLKERANKLIEKYTQEQLTYKSGTEEEVTELGNLLEQVVVYIDASKVPINEHVSSTDEEECVTPCVPPLRTTATTSTTLNEKFITDIERDELLNQLEDVAPGPKTYRKKRNTLLPEDELIKKKQEQDYELQVKRLKLEEKKWNTNLRCNIKRLNSNETDTGKRKKSNCRGRT